MTSQWTVHQQSNNDHGHKKLCDSPLRNCFDQHAQQFRSLQSPFRSKTVKKYSQAIYYCQSHLALAQMGPKIRLTYSRPYDEDLEDDMDVDEPDSEISDLEDARFEEETRTGAPAGLAQLPVAGQYFQQPTYTDRSHTTISLTDNYPYYDDSAPRAVEMRRTAIHRIDRAALAMGIERNPEYQEITRGAKEDERSWRNRMDLRSRHKRREERAHHEKLNPKHKNYDEQYAQAFRAVRQARRQRNNARRAAALVNRRAYDQAHGRPRVATPGPPEDSGDEIYAQRRYNKVESGIGSAGAGGPSSNDGPSGPSGTPGPAAPGPATPAAPAPAPVTPVPVLRDGLRRRRSAPPRTPFVQPPPSDFPLLIPIPKPGEYPMGVQTSPPSDRCLVCENRKRACDLGVKGWYPCSQCEARRTPWLCVNGRGRVKEERGANSVGYDDVNAGNARIVAFNEASTRHAAAATATSTISGPRGGRRRTTDVAPLSTTMARGRQPPGSNRKNRRPHSGSRPRRGGQRPRGRSASPHRGCDVCRTTDQVCSGGRPCQQCLMLGIPDQCEAGIMANKYREPRGYSGRYADDEEDDNPRNGSPSSEISNLYSASPPRRRKPLSFEEEMARIGTPLSPNMFIAPMIADSVLAVPGGPNLAGILINPRSMVPDPTSWDRPPMLPPMPENNILPMAGFADVGTVHPTSQQAHYNELEAAASFGYSSFGPYAPRTIQEEGFFEEAFTASIQAGQLGLQTAHTVFGSPEIPMGSIFPSPNLLGSPGVRTQRRPIGQNVIMQTSPSMAPAFNFPTQALLNWDGSGALGGPRNDPFENLAPMRRDWELSDQAAFADGNLCDETKHICAGIYLNIGSPSAGKCLQPFAKPCDHRSHSESYCICNDCHAQQNDFFEPEHQVVEQGLRAWVCETCADTIRRRRLCVRSRCLCFSSLRSGWWCHRHVEELLARFKQCVVAVDGYLNAAAQGHSKGQGTVFCVGCFKNLADSQLGVWGCKVCREWADL